MWSKLVSDVQMHWELHRDGGLGTWGGHTPTLLKHSFHLLHSRGAYNAYEHHATVELFCPRKWQSRNPVILTMINHLYLSQRSIACLNQLILSFHLSLMPSPISATKGVPIILGLK